MVWDLAANSGNNLWDSKAYYLSTKCFDENLNPYNTQDLSIVAERDWLTPFAYPPLTLNFFKIFNTGNIESSAIAYLSFKVCVLFFLILLWQKILNIKCDNVFYFLILLSFNSAVYIDLRVGNVTLIVQLLLWTGFLFYLRKKYLLFCIFIVLAATFKLIPIFFLALILFTKDKRKYLYLSCSLLAFIFYLFLNHLIYPFLFSQFIQSVFHTLEARGRGITHPALYSFIPEVLKQLYIVNLKNLTGIDMTSVIELLIFVILISLISVVTIRSLRKLKDANNIPNTDKELILISLTCIVFSLLIPRFKDYDYILLILPAFFILNKADLINPKYLLVFIFVIASSKVTLPGIKIVYKFLWDYYPLVQAIIVWLLYILYIKKFSAVADSKIMNGKKQQ